MGWKTERYISGLRKILKKDKDKIAPTYDRTIRGACLDALKKSGFFDRTGYSFDESMFADWSTIPAKEFKIEVRNLEVQD